MKRFLPLLAAVLLLLRPYCDAWALGGDRAVAAFQAQPSACDSTHGANSQHSSPCCANLDQDVIAKVSVAGAVRAGNDPMAPVVAPGRIPESYDAAAMLASLKPPGAPPGILSYYARSARIQR